MHLSFSSTSIDLHLPLFAFRSFTYRHLPLSALICLHLHSSGFLPYSSLSFISTHLPSFAFISTHLHSHAFICLNPRSLPLICVHFSSFPSISSQLLSSTFVCIHYAFIYLHLLLCASFAFIWFLKMMPLG